MAKGSRRLVELERCFSCNGAGRIGIDSATDSRICPTCSGRGRATPIANYRAMHVEPIPELGPNPAFVDLSGVVPLPTEFHGEPIEWVPDHTLLGCPMYRMRRRRRWRWLRLYLAQLLRKGADYIRRNAGIDRRNW